MYSLLYGLSVGDCGKEQFVGISIVLNLLLVLSCAERRTFFVLSAVCAFFAAREEKKIKMMMTTNTTNESIHPQETSETKRKKMKRKKKKKKNRKIEIQTLDVSHVRVVSLSLSQSQITVCRSFTFKLRWQMNGKMQFGSHRKTMIICSVRCDCVCVSVTRLFTYHFLWRMMMADLAFLAAAVAILLNWEWVCFPRRILTWFLLAIRPSHWLHIWIRIQPSIDRLAVPVQANCTTRTTIVNGFDVIFEFGPFFCYFPSISFVVFSIRVKCIVTDLQIPTEASSFTESIFVSNNIFF